METSNQEAPGVYESANFKLYEMRPLIVENQPAAVVESGVPSNTILVTSVLSLVALIGIVLIVLKHNRIEIGRK